jgi:hypothetical protein
MGCRFRGLAGSGEAGLDCLENVLYSPLFWGLVTYRIVIAGLGVGSERGPRYCNIR